jgi:class 3 adenylate cyclase/tetratricopeptide (TPR) repeat protein
VTTPEVAGGGRYEIRRLLGEGARKCVFLAHDTRLGRDVALAVVKTDGLDETGRARIDREARAMARLGDHPHVVTVFDIGDDGDGPYIVSQFMPGGSLADRLDAADEHRLSLDEALAVASDVARGLEHAHRHDIVHRDLKPANVWLDADGRARLGDFGLAVPVDQSRLTAEGVVVGTVAYHAPEQALGRSPDARADLYALGGVLYELLTGRPPFPGDDAISVITQHLNTAPVAPSWHNAAVTPAIDALVLGLLAKDPEARPESATVVLEQLAAVEAQLAAADEPAAAAPDALPATLLGPTRFVGRDEELTGVRATVDAALAGEHRVVMIVGEPGIGKTRLAEEVGAYASMRGAQVCWGHSYEGELGAPYLPFVEAFRGYLRNRGDAELLAELSTGAPEVATLVSELRDRFPDLPTSPPLEGDAERLRMFEGVTTFVRNAAAAQPLVLMLDDLHWADKPSLLLLLYLARNLSRDRVLLVGTYRDVELDRTHPLAETVAQLRRERLYERVLLRGLPRDDVKALIEVTGEQSTPDAFADLVYRETEGNPFFVSEILRHFVESGALHREGGRWVGTPESVAENLPEGVREVIGRRLSKLPDGCNEMLTVAAAMPGGFSIEVITAVTEQSEDDVLDHLDAALEAQVVRERGGAPGTYEFAHALFRQTLYGELSTPRRVRLHRKILAALEADERASTDARLPELAYHSFQAAAGGDIDKAVGYAVRAGVRASAQAAHEEAARFYEMALQALELTDDADPAQRAELLLAFGAASDVAGEPEPARAALLEAAAAGRELHDPVLLGRAALTLSQRWTSSGADPEMSAVLEEAVATLEPGSDELLRARLLNSLGSHVAFVDAERSDRLIDEAIAIARQAGDPGTLARALGSFAFTTRVLEDRGAAQAALDEAVALAREAGDKHTEVILRNSLMVQTLARGDYPAYAAQVDGQQHLARETRSPANIATAELAMTTRAVLEGRYADAERHGDECLALSRRVQDATMVQNYGVSLYPMWREQGRLGALEEPTRRTVERFPMIYAWRAGYAHLLAMIGDLDRAARELEVLAGHYDDIPFDVLRVYTQAAMAEIIVVLGGHDLATRLRADIESLYTGGVLLGSAAYHGSTWRYVGLLDTLLGRHDNAVSELETAVDRHETMHARPWATRTRYDLACALVARGGDGDTARAFALLHDALAAANDIGMTRLVEEAMGEQLRLQGVDESSAPGLSIDAVAAAVSVERPDLRTAFGGDGRLTIVFSDLEGYTTLTDRLGDLRSQDVLRTHNDLVRSALATHGGREVKSAGDGFMLVFDDPVAAVRFALDARDAVGAHDFGPDAGTLRLRIGLHAGRVIEEADDFYGRTVILASRVAATAVGGEILVTDAVRDRLEGVGIETDAGRDIELKGLAGAHRVYTLA